MRARENGADVAAAPDEVRSHRPVRWTPFGVGVAVLASVVLVVRVWSVSRWTWISDDWIYMQATTSMGFVEYLFQNYNGHVMPGEFLIQWVVTKSAPLDHGVATVLIACGSVLVVLAWAAALRELFGEHLRLLVPLALLTLTPLQVQSTIWWASALQALPLQGILALCVYLAARLVHRPQRHTRLALVGTFALGLFMWQKDVLLLIPIVAVLVFATPGTLGARLVRNGRTILTLAALSVAYLVGYVVLLRARPESLTPVRVGGDRSAGELVRSYGVVLGDLLAPAALGGPWGTLPVESDIQSGPPLAVAVLVSVVVAGLVLALALARVRGWMPVTMLLAYGLVSWGLVAFTSRLEMLQVTRLGSERYVVDVFVVGCLALAMLITPCRLEVGPVWQVRVRVPGARTRRRAVAYGVLGALSMSLLSANILAVNRIGVHPAKSWVANITADVEQLAPLSVYDAPTPDPVFPAIFFTDAARLSRVLSPLHQDIRFNEPGRPMYVATPSGRLRPAAIADGTHAEPGPVPGCGYAVAAGADLAVPMTQELYDFQWGVQVDAFAGRSAVIELVLDDETVEIEVPRGLSQTQAGFTGPVTRVRLRGAPGAGTVCVTNVVIGAVAPRRSD